jgi:hypothetical protein
MDNTDEISGQRLTLPTFVEWRRKTRPVLPRSEGFVAVDRALIRCGARIDEMNKILDDRGNEQSRKTLLLENANRITEAYNHATKVLGGCWTTKDFNDGQHQTQLKDMRDSYYAKANAVAEYRKRFPPTLDISTGAELRRHNAVVVARPAPAQQPVAGLGGEQLPTYSLYDGGVAMPTVPRATPQTAVSASASQSRGSVPDTPPVTPVTPAGQSRHALRVAAAPAGTRPQTREGTSPRETSRQPTDNTPSQSKGRHHGI